MEIRGLLYGGENASAQSGAMPEVNPDDKLTSAATDIHVE